MSDVYVSEMLRGGSYKKVGFCEKFYGHDWADPKQKYRTKQPLDVNRAMNRKTEGELLTREEFPEAAFVFNEKQFKNLDDFFFVRGFTAVTGKLAEVLEGADMGPGNLVPFPMYKEDKVTPMEGKFYFLNWAAQKDSFLPHETNPDAIEQARRMEKHGYEMWRPNLSIQEDYVALSPTALKGADIWVEPRFRGVFFLSERLVEAVQAAGVKVDLRLQKCRII